jgi:hypothetical protein
MSTNLMKLSQQNKETTDKFVAYGSLYLTIPGAYAAAPVLSAWMANNSEPYYRRASSIAFGFIATNSVRPSP